MWNVSSLEEFLYYNCPECENKYSTKEQFVGHAMVAHENARDILPTILKRENVKANEDKPIEEVDPEGFDDNGNDNRMGIQIAKVEPNTADMNGIPGSSSVEVKTEVIDDDEKEATTSNNDELNENFTEETKKCKECGNEFPSKQSLKRHRRVHKSFKCDLCPKAYSRKDRLSYHIQAVHKGKTYKCDQCKKGFKSKRDLYCHIQAVHNRKTYKCGQCGKVLKSIKEKRIHETFH